ncbi:MAG TPA: EamA family transporter [Bacteroidales bacterium]|nr:EamA family transporter [Bacteroidales bacterium]HPT12726.1 EamA family transporter [Bacteroidales bacterium]
MLKLIILSTVQSIFLMLSQVFLKITMTVTGPGSFSLSYMKKLFTCYQFALSGASIAVATVLWMYIIKNYPFSQAYPLISMSYVFGLLAAILVFHEAIPATRWIGVALIIVGVIFIAKQ